jgi:hypothetical protein
MSSTAVARPRFRRVRPLPHHMPAQKVEGSCCSHQQSFKGGGGRVSDRETQAFNPLSIPYVMYNTCEARYIKRRARNQLKSVYQLLQGSKVAVDARFGGSLRLPNDEGIVRCPLGKTGLPDILRGKLD